MMFYKPIALTAALVVAGVLSFGGAQAATVTTGSAPLPGIQKAQDTNVQQVSQRYRYRSARNGRYWRGNRYYGGGKRYYGGGRYWRRGSGIYLGLGLAPFLYGAYGGYGGYDDYYGGNAYYRPTYAPAGGSHVRYCLNRYRSYDPRSNTFLGYDGYRHRCRSPYRY